MGEEDGALLVSEWKAVQVRRRTGSKRKYLVIMQVIVTLHLSVYTAYLDCHFSWSRGIDCCIKNKNSTLMILFYSIAFMCSCNQGEYNQAQPTYKKRLVGPIFLQS